jgi:hypothetical protein
MDLFEQLRREHEVGVGTVAGVAAKFGVHRRLVRQALAGALPPQHNYPLRSKPKLAAVMAFIDSVLEADRRAPRKQRHTARRVSGCEDPRLNGAVGFTRPGAVRVF